jgi:hypothetical protein
LAGIRGKQTPAVRFESGKHWWTWWNWRGTSPAAILQRFNEAFGKFTFGTSIGEGALGSIDAPMRFHGSPTRSCEGQDGFASQFWEGSDPTLDQVHHFGAFFSSGLSGGMINRTLARIHRTLDDNDGDKQLGTQSRHLGDYLRANPSQLNRIGQLIRDTICNGQTVPK